MTNDLLNLKQSVFGEKSFEPKFEGLNGEHHLSRNSPAQICDDKIYILDLLSPIEREEAIAHELGHFLIRNKSVIYCQAYLNEVTEGQEFLFLEINNSLSHREIITSLTNEFNLSSGLHLGLQINALLNGGIEKKINDYSNDKCRLYAVGLELFDIQCTAANGNYDKEIHDLCAKNVYVKKGMEIGLKYFNSISTNSTKEEQVKSLAYAMNEFELGHLLDTRLYPYLPVEIYYKEEDVSHLVLNEIKSILMIQAQK